MINSYAFNKLSKDNTCPQTMYLIQILVLFGTHLIANAERKNSDHQFDGFKLGEGMISKFVRHRRRANYQVNETDDLFFVTEFFLSSTRPNVSKLK